MVSHNHLSTDDNTSSLTAEEQAELEQLEYEAAMYDSAASAADPELAASLEAKAAKAWERIAEIYQAHGIDNSGDPEAAPKTNDPTILTIAQADQLVDDVAQLLPFPTTLDADMGGTWANQIYFGDQIDESTGCPIHRAGIDPDEEDPVWWLDFDRGARQIISDLGPYTSVTDVADWIIANTTGGES
ncbi:MULTISPECIES: hypothetical protein [unclassified Microbacterium]|uniref:hypothetical protein n=1 Tax=unclassified Microbacterium TaxID=2609290 RepID=UPI00301A2778